MEPSVIFNSISVSLIICGVIYYTIQELPSCITVVKDPTVRNNKGRWVMDDSSIHQPTNQPSN